MASTYSDLKIELIGTGEQVGTWGATTNTNLGTAIEDAITGSANVSFSSADVTLVLTNTNGSQTARNLRLVCTGTSGGARNLILGSGCQINKLYLVQNDLADTVTVKNTSGTGVAIPAGGKNFVFNNGTNVIEATLFNLSSGVSGTLAATNGGTGLTSPGSSGNVLTSNGTTWTSASLPSPLIPSGTVMLFAQTAAPTGFTKNTSTGDNHALRVVTGTASSGGSVDFSTAFTSQTPSGTVSVSGSAGATTLTIPQIPSHSHTAGNSTPRASGPAPVRSVDATGIATGSEGGGGSHDHPLSISSSTFSGNAINLAVKYIDVIRATKD
jgi:hypothetical protein